MGKITINELHKSLFGYIQAVSDESLETKDKTIVGAINELIQNSNSNKTEINNLINEISNGKQLIANAIGEPLTAEDSFTEMSNDINSLLSTFKTNMMNSGVTVESEDKFKALIDKIKELTEDEGNKGVQYVEGTIESAESSTYVFTTVNGNTKSQSYAIIPKLPFEPTILILDVYDNISGRTWISILSYDSSLSMNTVKVGSFSENPETASSYHFKADDAVLTNDYIRMPIWGNKNELTFKYCAIGVGEGEGEGDTTLSGGLDIISATKLPTTGKKDQICVITDNPIDNFLITTDFKDTQSTSAICIYLGDAEDVLPSSALTITKGNITNIYYFNRICQQNKRLASYHYANNQWNLITRATIPVYENNSFPSEDVLGFSPVRVSDTNVFINKNEIFFATADSYIRGFTFPNIIDFSSYHKVTIVAHLVPNYVAGNLYVASMKQHYTSVFDIPTNTVTTDYAYDWIVQAVSSETEEILTYDISSFTGSGYLGIVAGGSRSNFYIQEIILE